MLDIERIVELSTGLTEVSKKLDLISIRPSEVHLTQKGLLEVEPDKSLWTIVDRDCAENPPLYPIEAFIILEGVRWFAIGTKEEFGVYEDTSD